MKCDMCNKPAVVHEVTIKSGVKKEVHLCTEHAKEMGIPVPGQHPVNQLLTQFVVGANQSKGQTVKSAARGRAGKKLTCPSCGLTFSKFRQTGILGCPDCYKAFEDPLSRLIQRAQNDATHHVGKSPKRAGGSIDRQAQIRRLLKELDSAVAAEQYERAASLRDRLKQLENAKSTDSSATAHGDGANESASASN